MFEKLKARFDLQKSDDAFVEAATNASARQEMIDKLVKARAKINRAFLLIAVLYLFSVLIEVFARDSSVASHPSGISNQVLIIAVMLVLCTGFDLQIKFLKALEASAGQISQKID